MTETRIPGCHYDRGLEQRVTRRHADTCPTQTGETGRCPGRDGCQPCTETHCTLCSREHLAAHGRAHPVTCPECVGRVRTDLEEILWCCRHLRWQATRAGRDGRLAAAAPIPGGDALVLYARAGVDGDDLRTYRGFTADHLDEDHHPKDPVPVLLPLASWDTQWRRHHGHQPPATPSVSGVIHYLIDHLTRMAQTTTGPDWPGFAADMAALRRQLEAVLHDEQDPEQGVPCFECGDRLVRQFGDPHRCRHRTPARVELERLQARAAAGRATLAAIATYPELASRDFPRGYTPGEQAAARPPTSAQVSAASKPCEKCATSRTGQGGIADPTVGQSWECTGCRKHYTPGEYANAVRSHLLTSGPNGDGWTHIAMAAEAATTQTGLAIPQGTVRKWLDRGKISGLCRWSPGIRAGQRLVYWPDVADQAAAAIERHHAAELERRRRDEQEQQLRDAVAAGQDVYEAGKRHGIHPARVDAIAVKLERERRSETAAIA